MRKMKLFRTVLFAVAALLLPVFLCACNENEAPADPTGEAVVTPAPVKEYTWEEIKDGSVMSMAVFSDVHYGQTMPAAENLVDGQELSNPEGKLRAALKAYYQMAPDLDAICIAGDLTDNGWDDEYKGILEIVEASITENNPDTKLIATMGNHEFYRNYWGYPVGANGEWKGYHAKFEQYTKNSYVSDNVIGGIHVLGFSPNDELDNFEPREEWLMDHIKAAAEEDPTKPIVLIAHKAIEGTVVGSTPATQLWQDPQTFKEELVRAGNCADWSDTFLKFLENYPQVIYFSGHTHHLISDPLSIHQDSITSLQCGTLGSTTGYRDTSGFYERYGRSMGYLFTMDAENVVRIYKINFTDGTFYGDPYVLDIPKIVEDKDANFAYTDKRYETSLSPVFAEGASLEVKREGANVTIKWPEAALAEGDTTSEFVFMYKIRFFNYEKNAYVPNTIRGETCDYYPHYTTYYSDLVGDVFEESYSFLKEGTKYRIEVTAVTPFDVESEPLIYELG